MDREENCNKNLSCLNMALKRSSQIQRMPSPYQKPEMFCKIWKSKTNTRKCQYKHITTIKFHNVYRIEFCKKTKHSGLPWSVARKIWHINGYVAWNQVKLYAVGKKLSYLQQKPIYIYISTISSTKLESICPIKQCSTSKPDLPVLRCKI